MSEVIPVDNTSSTPIATASPKTKTNDAKTEKKKRNKKKSKRNSRKPTLKTKVIVRRLAPNLPEDIFMNSVKPWVSEDNVTYSLYVPGKLSKRCVALALEMRVH
jgi:regulator of nonsense transcripts 3